MPPFPGVLNDWTLHQLPLETEDIWLSVICTHKNSIEQNYHELKLEMTLNAHVSILFYFQGHRLYPVRRLSKRCMERKDKSNASFGVHLHQIALWVPLDRLCVVLRFCLRCVYFILVPIQNSPRDFKLMNMFVCLFFDDVFFFFCGGGLACCLKYIFDLLLYLVN